MPLTLEVWGKYAMFTRPEFKVEKTSYDMITPSAAIGILEAIYWHPGITYHIDKIHLLPSGDENYPFEHLTVMRNEIGNEKATLGTAGKERIDLQKQFDFLKKGDVSCMDEDTISFCPKHNRSQSIYSFLKDPHYVIEAHFELTDECKHTADDVYAIFMRRARKGQCFKQPYFGLKECVAHFQVWEGKEIPKTKTTVDMGLMFHSFDYSCYPPKRRFFNARVNNGTCDVANSEVIEC